jgi:hypothetical protein
MIIIFKSREKFGQFLAADVFEEIGGFWGGRAWKNKLND